MEGLSRREFALGSLAVIASGALLARGKLSAGATGDDASSGEQQENGGGADEVNAALVDGKETVRVAFVPITHALPVFELASQWKGGGAEGIQVQLVQYGSWPELMDALDSGKVDAASVLVELAMRAAEQGIDVKALALGHRDGNVIVASQGVGAVSDLAGKTIAIPARQSSHYLLVLQALANAGIAETAVTFTELAPTEMPSALASGRIDAYCVAEPFGAKGVKSAGGHVLADSEDLWSDSVCCALVANGQFLSSRPEVAARFVRGYKDAGNDLDSRQGRPLEVAKEFLSQDDDVLQTSLQWISYRDLTIDEKTYDELVSRMRAAGLTQNPPAFGDFVASVGDAA